ncbi:MAG: cytochrome C [Betaproteobacteria bacterium]|nr:cytochrome C [Betaproteobacteria bacterium]
MGFFWSLAMRRAVVWVMLAGSLWAQSVAAQSVNDGRLLASGCFQCHGTSGLKGGFGTLAGMGKEDMLNKLNNDMRSKDARSSIMNPHARGYTSYQLTLIADYFSKLPKP